MKYFLFYVHLIHTLLTPVFLIVGRMVVQWLEKKVVVINLLADFMYGVYLIGFL